MVELLLFSSRAYEQEGVTMYTQANERQPLTSSDATGKQWKPKLVSTYSVVVGGLGIISLALFAISTLLEGMSLDAIPEFLLPLFQAKATCLVVGIVLIVIAIAIEAVSRLRTPPPTWRVKEELIRAMGDMGLLELNNMDRWQGKFAVAPVGRYNRQAKCFTVPFLLRNVNATEDKFKSMEKSIAGFARSLDCSIEQDNSRRLYNFKLVLWYDDPYSNIDNINPF